MKVIKNINPKILILDNFDIEEGIKFNLLPILLDNKKYFITKEKDFIDALNYYNKIDFPFEVILTDEDSFARVLNQFLEVKTQKDLQKDIEEEISFEEIIKESDDILNPDSAPVIKFVNSIFFQAIKKKASDIHIETHENFGSIRFRIDGVLFTEAKIQKKLTELVINRIKVISNLDISEKRIPQDGRTQIKIDKKI